MIADKKKFENTKYDDLVEVICDCCSNKLKRTKRRAKNDTNRHYCDNVCQAKLKRRETRERILSKGSKKCTGLCKEEKKLEEFNKSKIKPDGFNSICRVCSNDRSKLYYSENTDKHKREVSERTRKVVAKHRKRYYNILKNSSCTDCGTTGVMILEFDHNDDVDKLGTIGAMVHSGCSWKKIEVEMSKCEIKCANCHRERTARQFSWYKDLL